MVRSPVCPCLLVVAGSTNSSGIQLIMPEFRHEREWGIEVILWMYQCETDFVVGSKAIPPYPLLKWK
jgi:hypothetical protein